MTFVAWVHANVRACVLACVFALCVRACERACLRAGGRVGAAHRRSVSVRLQCDARASVDRQFGDEFLRELHNQLEVLVSDARGRVEDDRHVTRLSASCAAQNHYIIHLKADNPLSDCLCHLESFLSYSNLVLYNYVCHCVLYIQQSPYGTPIQIIIQ